MQPKETKGNINGNTRSKPVFPTPAVPMIISPVTSTLLKIESIQKMKVAPEVIEERNFLMARE